MGRLDHLINVAMNFEVRNISSLNKAMSITDALHQSLTKRGKFGMDLAFEANAAAAKRMGIEIANAEKQLGKFDMRWLSVMFMGMALKRVFGGALKELFNTFKKIGGEQSIFNKKTTEVSASWTFLKFSIINALQQSPLFMAVIDFLVNAINWVSELINKFPALGTSIVVAFGVLATGGVIMTTIGSFMLFWNSVFGIGGLLGKSAAAGMGTTAAARGTVAGAMKGGMGVLRKIVGIGILIGVATNILKRGPEYQWTAMDFFTDIGMAAIGGFAIGGWWGAGAAVAVTLAWDLIKSGKLQSWLDELRGFTSEGFDMKKPPPDVEARMAENFRAGRDVGGGALTMGAYDPEAFFDMMASQRDSLKSIDSKLTPNSSSTTG